MLIWLTETLTAWAYLVTVYEHSWKWLRHSDWDSMTESMQTYLTDWGIVTEEDSLMELFNKSL